MHMNIIDKRPDILKNKVIPVHRIPVYITFELRWDSGKRDLGEKEQDTTLLLHNRILTLNFMWYEEVGLMLVGKDGVAWVALRFEDG